MKSKNQHAIIVFQKNLVLGKVKTRLAQSLGDQKALEIYKYLVDVTFNQLQALTGLDVFIFFSDFVENLPTGTPSDFLSGLQRGNDLGERMSNAFIDIFEKGYKSALLIGTDCPSMKKEILFEAIENLKNHDVVLGPATDGGYYLLGLKKIIPELFQYIPWGTGNVLELSLDVVKAKKSSYHLLSYLSDIDTLEDWENYLKRVENLN
jgi:uncharacterized protein